MDVPVKEKLLHEVEQFDHKDLKDVKEVDKTPSQMRDMTMAAIQNLRPGSLKPTETLEKNILPGKDDIEAEKKQAA